MKSSLFTLLLCLVFVSSQAQVVINELVASNDSTSNIQDEYGEYDDWVELYNNGSATVDLSGYYITDDSQDPLRWAFPANTSIGANEYLIVWTDKDENNMQVPLHTNFRLNAAGETVLLSDPSGVYVDSVAFPALLTNEAYSRIPNGTGDFKKTASSFNQMNEDINSTENLDRGTFKLYPNPTTDLLTIEFQELPQQGTLEIMDINGVIYSTMELNTSKTELNIKQLATGTYYLKINADSQTVLRPFQKL